MADITFDKQEEKCCVMSEPPEDMMMSYEKIRAALICEVYDGGPISLSSHGLGLYVTGWSKPWPLFLDGNDNMRAICPTAPNVRPIVRPPPITADEPPIPLCVRCDHKATSHVADDEERRECMEWSCRCEQFEAAP